ncbi:MAG: 16S rRNA (adenine(1518)-N(6)/adenine(1519)-N(6))-dimethyltransferase RsmA [bacterium]
MSTRKKDTGVRKFPADKFSQSSRRRAAEPPVTFFSHAPKKSLGQNFLHNAHYLGAVADAGALASGEVVLEVGPGTGNLTKELLARGAKVVAIEKDHRLIETLRETFYTEIKEKKLELVEGDALTFDLHEAEKEKLLPQNYKVIANIPYYITGALLRTFLSTKHQPSVLVFLVQKEVAERITGHGAKNKKENLLSLSVKAYGAPRYAGTVPRGAFNPLPSVDSAILAVSDISRKNFVNKTHEDRFFGLIHAGFAQKRKLLKRNLETVFDLSEKILPALQKAGIPENARAEDIALDQWLSLAKN